MCACEKGMWGLELKIGGFREMCDIVMVHRAAFERATKNKQIQQQVNTHIQHTCTHAHKSHEKRN